MDNIKDLQKILGDMTTATEIRPVGVLPTGLVGVDKKVLGCGGFPRGRYVTLKSRPSEGKSSIALFLTGIVQKKGGRVAWIESEGAFTTEYAKACGVKVEELDFVDNFTTGEDALYRIKQRIATNIYDLIVVDSKDYLIPESVSDAKIERQTQFDEQQQAKMFTSFFRSLFGGYSIKGADGKYIEGEREFIQGGKPVKTWHKLSDKKTCLLFIEHAKDNVRSFIPGATRVSGGEESKFGATIRLGLKLQKIKKEKDKILYKEVSLFSDKNKLGLPFGSCDLLLYADGRIEEANSEIILVDFAIEKGIMTQKGAWIFYKDEKFQGKEKASEYICENKELKEEILL